MPLPVRKGPSRDSRRPEARARETQAVDSQRSQQFRDLIDISREMLVQAREDAWERVGELEAQRRALMAQCFRHPTAEQDAPGVAASIREILHLDEEVAALGRKHRQTLGADIHTNRVGRSARAAYQGCSR